MICFYAISLGLVCVSFFFSREKTLRAFEVAFKRFQKIIPALIMMMVFVSVMLFCVPEKLIVQYLGNTGRFTGVVLASAIGSITFIPGFIAYPLCAILLKKGVTYMVLSAFTTSLMMVGVITFPLGKAYFGTRVTILRNAAGLAIALCVALVTGVCFGELF